MIREVKFESQERRIKQVIAALNENGIKDIEEANQICEGIGVDPYKICEDTQGICFENAKWAYVCGAAIAIKKGVKSAAEAAEAIGIGLQSFCIPGRAEHRRIEFSLHDVTLWNAENPYLYTLVMYCEGEVIAERWYVMVWQWSSS